MSTREKLTVVIPTYNCAAIIASSLESVAWADEIIVVDMGSTDRTLEIAQKYKAKIISHIPGDGNFDKNRLLGMQQARGDWILKLDSDEELTKPLQTEIRKLLSSEKKDSYSGFNLYNDVYFFGRQVKHGFVKPGSHELRLFRKGAWSYIPFRFHQQITVNGKTGFLLGHYKHYNYRSISEFLQKTNKYTSFDAKFFAKRKVALQIMVPLAPIKTFMKLFFLQKGFLDGLLGLETCFLYSLYNLIEKVKIWENIVVLR
jgi:glycosyltransferase involved in cell wall biosynthesis